MSRLGPIFGAIAAGSQSLQGDRARKKAEEQTLEDRVLRREMHELQKRSLEQALQTPKSSQVQWDTRETPDGLVQIHPVTGEVRPVTLEGRVLQPPRKATAPVLGTPEYNKAIADAERARASVRPPRATQPKPTPPSDKDRTADFMLEGAQRAEQTLRGYSASPRTWVNRVPGLGNYGQSEKDQIAQQAAETLHDAYLRITTGATINPSELARAAKQYIPEPGDSPGVLRAKAMRRKEIIDAMRRSAARVRNGVAVVEDDEIESGLPNP